jgi:hypothetical protein
MASMIRALPAILMFLLPLGTAAQSDDGAYCRALAAEYQKYYVETDGHSPQSGPIDGNIAADQCRAGNTAGIPVLERKLRDARVPLPARG